jgi:hypothetical protein
MPEGENQRGSTRDKLGKDTYSGGRKPKGLNKIDKLAKVTYARGRKSFLSPFGFLPLV